jgi:hypothetical protein
VLSASTVWLINSRPPLQAGQRRRVSRGGLRPAGRAL